MSLNLPFGTRVLNPFPVDDKAFNASGQPYTDLNEVKTQVTSGVRHKGLRVFVDDGSGGVAEYWWKDGITDNDLVPYIPSTIAFELRQYSTTSIAPRSGPAYVFYTPDDDGNGPAIGFWDGTDIQIFVALTI